MAAHKKPIITSAVLADAHRASTNGKLDALGLFDRFLVWGIPATRECSVVVRIENVPAGESRFIVVLQDESKRIQSIGKFKCVSKSSQFTAINAFRLPINFTEIGKYKIGFRHEESEKKIFWFSFSVNLMPWLELPTGDRLEAMLADAQTIKQLRASIKCSKCKKTLTFQLSLDPAAKLDRNIKPFPSTGKIKCPSCSLVHNLRDIEGQLRFHLVNQGDGGRK